MGETCDDCGMMLEDCTCDTESQLRREIRKLKETNEMLESAIRGWRAKVNKELR